MDSANKMLSLMNVRYVLSRREIKSQNYRLVMPGSVKIYENINTMPRAYYVKSHTVKKKDEVIDYMMSDCFNPEREVVLEKNPVLQPVSPGTVKTGDASVRIVYYAAEEVIIEVNALDVGWLVLSDTYFPGWNACVDGVETDILRANCVFRAVHVKKGANRVIFKYDPVSYRVGETVTIVSLFLILAVIFAKKRGWAGPCRIL